MVPPTLHPDKALLRRRLRAERARFVAALGSGERQEAEARVAAAILAERPPARRIALYLARGAELDLGRAIEGLAAAGVTTLIPRLEMADAPMVFVRWRPGDPLEDGPFGPQPRAGSAEAPELVVAPLVGFDRCGHRLGQGGGFYDRALARLPATRLIGIGWSVQEVPSLPIDPWDRALDAVVTEKERIVPWTGRAGASPSGSS